MHLRIYSRRNKQMTFSGIRQERVNNAEEMVFIIFNSLPAGVVC